MTEAYRVIDSDKTQSIIDNRTIVYIPIETYRRLGNGDGVRKAHRQAFDGSIPMWCQLFEDYYAVEVHPLRGQSIEEAIRALDDALYSLLPE